MPPKAKETISDNALLMAEWDWEKNALFDPSILASKSGKKVWWKCKKGHQYESSPEQRTRGQGCPFCANQRVYQGYNDLATTHPQIIIWWDFVKNSISPQEITYGTNKSVWWKCAFGHSYQMPVIKKTTRNFGCPICSGHRTISGVNDFFTCYPELAKQWHPQKNKGLSPSNLSKKNGQKVWWICQFGHEWEATLKDRANDNTGCPICQSRRSTSFPEQAIFYYIKIRYPEAINRYKDILGNKMELDVYIPSIRVAIEYDGIKWHNTEDSHLKEKEKYNLCKRKNITLIRVKEYPNYESDDIADIIYVINKRNFEDLNNVIQKIINYLDLTYNQGEKIESLYSNGKCIIDLKQDENEIRMFLNAIPNSLVELRPDLAKEWHPIKNGNLSPNMFGINSNDRAWWKCRICGHEWQTAIIQRGGKQNSGCPICSKEARGKTFIKNKIVECGSLADNNPSLSQEWHPTKNGNLTPENITAKSAKNIWWVCSKCKHEWQSSPNSRIRGRGCPCCSGRVPKIGINDFETLFPELAKEWHFSKNLPNKPNQFLPKSGKKFWWKCNTCKFEWETEIRVRTSGHGCPKCAKKKDAVCDFQERR